MTGPCKLCGAIAPLSESHIVPRFVIQWLKKTGGGYFRQVVDPNKRKQDGPKKHWLCGVCEERFSSRETYFAANVFYPYMEKDVGSFQYDERLFYCFVSLLWRSAIWTLAHADYHTHWTYPLVANAERDWRGYLLVQSAAPNSNSIRVFLSDVTAGPTIPTKNFNSYMARAIDATVGFSKRECFVYIKFCRFLLFGAITPIDESKWINTRIHVGGGTLKTPSIIKHAGVGSFLVNRAEVSRKEYESRVSQRTKERIAEHYKRELPRLVGSDLLRVQYADYLQEVVPPPVMPEGKVGRNDPCPCGSGKKYKKCHGA